jgi:hypothetical protein
VEDALSQFNRAGLFYGMLLWSRPGGLYFMRCPKYVERISYIQTEGTLAVWKPTGTLSRIAFVPLAAVIAAAGCASTTEPVDAETQAAVEEFVYGTIGEYSKERSDAALGRWSYEKDEFTGAASYLPPSQDLDYTDGERLSGDAMVYPGIAVSEGGEVYLLWRVSYMGFGWMFMDEMLVLVEERTFSFPIEASYDISTDRMPGGKVRENSTSIFPKAGLGNYGKLADASTARLRISGSEKSLDRDFTATELKLIREARDIYLALTQ